MATVLSAGMDLASNVSMQEVIAKSQHVNVLHGNVFYDRSVLELNGASNLHSEITPSSIWLMTCVVIWSSPCFSWSHGSFRRSLRLGRSHDDPSGHLTQSGRRTTAGKLTLHITGSPVPQHSSSIYHNVVVVASYHHGSKGGEVCHTSRESIASWTVFQNLEVTTSG